MAAGGVVALLVIVLLVLAALSIKIVREYERLVVFRLGRLVGPRGPGLVWILPLLDRTRKVSLQIDTADIRPQAKSVVQIRDYEEAILRIAQTTLRATLSQHDLDDLLANQEVFNEQLKTRIDAATEPWGVQVVGVETKDIDLPDTMQRAMARQAEAERERRAKVIAAEGEYQAAERLAEAAALLGREKDAITLRTLQTLAEVATEQNSTLIFPVPADLISSLRWGAPPAPDLPAASD